MVKPAISLLLMSWPETDMIFHELKVQQDLKIGEKKQLPPPVLL